MLWVMEGGGVGGMRGRGWSGNIQQTSLRKEGAEVDKTSLFQWCMDGAI
jgi:hypothetical protein